MIKSLCVILGVTSLTAMSACGADGAGSGGAGGAGGGAGGEVCIEGGGGLLKITLTGAIAEDIDWSNASMTCAGAGKPPMMGWSSVFTRAKTASSGQLDVAFETFSNGEGFTGTAVLGRVSVILEGKTSPFETPDDGCTIDFTEHTKLSDTAVGRLYKVSGKGKCTQPAKPTFPTEMGEVMIGDFEFTGVTAWAP